MSSGVVAQDSALGDRSRGNWKRHLTRVAAIAALLYFVALAGFYYAMKQPPETFARVMMHTGPAPFLLFPFETMWMHARAGTLRVGDPAPEFRLPLLDGSGSIQLSSFRGARPVVLIFGSYT